VGRAGIKPSNSGGDYANFSYFALRSYRCHMMALIVMWIDKLGV